MRSHYFKRVVLATLSAGLLFTSCSDSPDDIDKKGQTEGDFGYISLALVNSSISAVTKATDYGTADENKVKSALIILYGKDDDDADVVKYHILLDGIGSPAAPGDDIHSISPGSNATTYRTKAQKVDKAKYQLAVFINPPTDLTTATAKGNALSAMTTAAEVEVEDLIGEDSDSFLMSNFAGLVEVNTTDIYDTEEKAVAAPVRVEVERAVAKVSLGLGENFDKEPNAFAVTIGEIKWDVDVINTKTFWMRETALMLNKNTIEAGKVTGTTDEVTDADNRLYMYATDPNMSGQSRLGDIGEELSDEFTFQSGLISLSLEPSTTEDAVATYVTENTMDAGEQWEDVTTTVLISAVLTPTKTFFADSFDEEEPYFLYRNKVFTLTDIQEIYKTNSDTGENSTTITSASLTWKSIIGKTEYADIIALPTILEAIKSEFGGDYVNFTQTASKEVYHANGTVRYFAAGAPNYYYVPIRHFDNDLQSVSMAYGRYGVVRNNWYDLSLNSINSYGLAQVPDLEDRLDQDDKEGSWLSIEFKILPWMKRNNGIDL